MDGTNDDLDIIAAKHGLCAGGFPIKSGSCPYCGATDDDVCGRLGDLSAAQIRENILAVVAGKQPVHT